MIRRGELEPAHPDVELGRPAYLPRVPWKWVGLGAFALCGLLLFSWLGELRKAAALREQIVAVHTKQLAPATQRYAAFRRTLEHWITSAANENPPKPFADPRLKMASLHQGNGLYLRLSASDATTRDGISRAAKRLQSDAITRCLGLSPASARGLYEKGSFLESAWLDGVRKQSSVMRLRVLDDELARRIRRDLPSVATLLQSQWFLLAIERGPSRVKGPVDVFLWDLRRNELLMRTRTEANGTLIPFRYNAKGAPPSPRVKIDPQTSGAQDCSIAAQIKDLTGEPQLRFDDKAHAGR